MQKLTGNNSIAIGAGHLVSGNNSGTFSDPNIVDTALMLSVMIIQLLKITYLYLATMSRLHKLIL